MVNKIHPKMERSNRAKQFMPFDALKGFRETLLEKEQSIMMEQDLPEETDLHFYERNDIF